MSDFLKIRTATTAIERGDIDGAWDALTWVFHSTDLDTEGFFQTATRLGISAEQFRSDLLEKSAVARAFYYGKDEVNE